MGSGITGYLVLIILFITTVLSQLATDPLKDVAPEDLAITKEYLRTYGYGNPESEAEIYNAITKMQRMMNLPATGIPNQATLDMFNARRCKVKDPGDRLGQYVSPPYIHNANQSIWENSPIFYNIGMENDPDRIAAIGRAVLAWTRTTPLSIAYSGDASKINIPIEFVSDEDIFGSLTIEVSRGYPPPKGLIQLNKVLPFDYSPMFDPTGMFGLSLERIMLHELGHALGLEHVPGTNTVMNPYYEYFSLHSEPQPNDILGINTLYVTCEAVEEMSGMWTLTWPATMKGQIAASVEVCPSYSINVGKPLAYRYCRHNLSKSIAEWDEPTNFTACLEGDPNGQAANLSKIIVNETNVVEIAGALVEVTNNTEEVTATGLDAIADTLTNIADVKYPSPEVTSYVVHTINNVLSVSEMHLQSTPKANTPTRILRSLETQLSTLQLKGGNFSETLDNIAVKAYNYPIENFQSLVFAKLTPSSNKTRDPEGEVKTRDDPEVEMSSTKVDVFYAGDDLPEDQIDTSIQLPTEILSRFLNKTTKKANKFLYGNPLNNTTPSTIPVTFTVFERNRLFVPYERDVSFVNDRDRDGPLRTEETTNSKTGSYGHHPCEIEYNRIDGEVQGHVISASVEGVPVIELEDPVLITISVPYKTSRKRDFEAHLHCVYWSYREGNWASTACSLHEILPNGKIVCACSHLTNFAVVLSPYNEALAHLAYDVFNIIAICLSIIGLLVTLIMYFIIPKLNQQPSIQIHMHFMISLLCLYVVFIIGIDMTHLPNGCICVAILLHFFTLSTVFLMGAEALTMYVLFVSVKGQQGGIKHIPHYVSKVAAVAWGTPLVIVIITVSTSYCQYYNTDYCFLPTGNPLYYGEILPIGIILLVNFVIFSLVTYRITCQRKFKRRGANNNKTNYREKVRQFYRVLSLFSVLGLSWIFGLLSSIYYVRSVFQVLFSITTTLQGVFIFLLFCARHQDVLAKWRKWAKRMRKGGEDAKGKSYRSEVATTPRSPTTRPYSTTTIPPVSPISLYPAKSEPPSFA